MIGVTAMIKIKKAVELIPNKVRITREATYEVLYTDAFLTDPAQFGECRYDPKQILMRNSQSDSEKVQTFIHEVLHAISFENDGLNLTEKQVMILERSLFRVFKLNGLFK